MMPTIVNEAVPVPPTAYYRVQDRLGPALHIDALTVSFNGCDFTRFNTNGTTDSMGVGNIPHSSYTMFNTEVTPNKRLDSVGAIDSTGENYTITWAAYS